MVDNHLMFSYELLSVIFLFWKINQYSHPSKFGSLRHYGNEYTMILVYHVISQDHEI